MLKSVPKMIFEKYHRQVVHGRLTIRTGHLAPLAVQGEAQLLEQFVARDMTARIVDDLELVEVHVQHRVLAVPLLRGFEQVLQAPFEFPPVGQAGERVVARLIGHLPRETADFRNVVQQDHGTLITGTRGPYGRGTQLDGMFLPARKRNQQ